MGIGRGVRHVKLEDVGADYAYTLDGTEAGEITHETFSADKAVVTITGVSTHPSSAFGVMVNALNLAAKFIDFLPNTRAHPKPRVTARASISLQNARNRRRSRIALYLPAILNSMVFQSHGDLLRATSPGPSHSRTRAR